MIMDNGQLKKGYKRTEVGVIPEEWGVKAAAELCIKIQDGTHFSPKIKGNDYLYVTSKNIGHGTLDVSDAGRIDSEQHRTIYSRCDVKKGDLLLTKDGANTGNAAINHLNEEFSLLSSVAILRFDCKFHVPEFYLQYILSSTGKECILKLMSGNAITRLTLDTIRQLRFLEPPIEEQRAIATALSDVDALIAALDKLIGKKRAIKTATMQQLLIGKKRLPGFGLGKGYKQTDIGRVPEDWDAQFLGAIFDFSGGYSASRDQLSSDGHCYLHYGDIHKSNKSVVDVRAEYSDIPKLNILLRRVSPKSLLSDGDVVFVDASEDDEGTSKHIVVINHKNAPFIAGLHTIVSKSKASTLENLYKRYCFQSNYIKRQFYFYSVGTKVSGISKTNIVKIKMIVPPIPEQKAIATILSDMDTEITALESRRNKIQAIKQGMMQELLTGRTRLI